MQIDGHGGECCGISHIFSFNNDVSEVKGILDELIDEQIDEMNEVGYDEDDNECQKVDDSGDFSHVFEVCLTDNQMLLYGPTLKEYGFKIVNRWINHNTDNHVTMLHFNRNPAVSKPPYEVW